jgi:acyl-CoA dehydrogenase
MLSHTTAAQLSEITELAHRLGNDIIAPAAVDVDKQARFPHEAFAAFKSHKLLSSYVPIEFGGMGLSITEICKLCEIFGGYCASTAMIFAMHQIQVACIVHHCENSDYFKKFLRDLVTQQHLLASATTELGVGGDLRSSLCFVKTEGEQFTLEKQAPVISYGVAADFIMVTCRRNEQVNASDQVQVLVDKKHTQLEQISDWDTLGFRGTCSAGFTLKTTGNIEQIQPAPFGDILAQSMHPVSHLVWGSLWLGLAQSAVVQARATVRVAARKNPSTPPISALRLTELDERLFGMRAGLQTVITEYQTKLLEKNPAAFSEFGFAIRVNNVKLRCSELVVEVVSDALAIVGIAGYKNNTPNSLSRHLRDAFGAALMVNNDRIRNHNSTMQIMVRDTHTVRETL